MNSILDNDLYKFTMENAVLELFPNTEAEYKFINRGSQRFNNDFLKVFRGKLQTFKYLALSPNEESWFMTKCPYLKSWYLDYLKNYRFNPNELKFSLDDEGQLHLTISGPWHRTILWEVPLLATISETYFETVETNWVSDNNLYADIFNGKMRKFEENDCQIIDFGTRRRRNFATQDIVVREGVKFPNFIGTSNVYLAMKHNTNPRGTMAHEWFMAISAIDSLRHVNYYALQEWVRVYNADLGTALTDTYGLDSFLANFNLRLSKLYDGVRHDSGDPFAFIDKIVAHYKGFKIDPMSKYALFSDGLNPDKAVAIRHYADGKIKVSFGIGTNFTNDYSFCNSKPLDIVIKMSKMNNIPVVKLSDSREKSTGDIDSLRVARWTFYNEPLDSSLK